LKVITRLQWILTGGCNAFLLDLTIPVFELLSIH